MRFLMVGDIVGAPGRRAVRENVPALRSGMKIDFVIANGENAAGGNGITREVAKELLSCGVDVLTMGNHVWNHKEALNYIAGEERMVRPLNYPPGAPGAGVRIFELETVKIAVVNCSGRIFMASLDCPFRAMDQVLNALEGKAGIILVDFHAEATSEKVAMGWHLAGRVAAVCGTHTHVQTADERVLPGGTAYITDVGMTGPRDSVIGVKRELVLEKFISQLPRRFEVAVGLYQFNAVLIDIDAETGEAVEIRRIQNYE
ncbi:TIGR00282 family metallophosphoesterase [Desulfotomaculum copahuensis]|uniref:Metallophosphoesterase n=1 Tax=Desulfotomaculum copahuensis TaxID=1838280 RepID=A0A1B7LJF2_9FIRM|nr:TIGR00282 family metallophosphoesterase [Desulfotomaculum copahuensis]OAT86698.1 metallophosphoesterase [Desulfotomaculum copahuensis]